MSYTFNSNGMPDNNGTVTYKQAQVPTEIINKTISKVFVGLFVGLIVTGLGALLTLSSGFLYLLMTSRFVFFAIVIAQFALVIGLSAALPRLSTTTAVIMFLIYTGLMGITISVIALVYSFATISMAFFSSAVIFGGMALWGAKTKRDLSSIGTVGFMLLIGSIFATFINALLYLIMGSGFGWLPAICNYVILAAFIGLTAYDMQRIKAMAASPAYFGGRSLNRLEDGELNGKTTKLAVMGALMLYLDFINIFLSLLRIFGGSESRD